MPELARCLAEESELVRGHAAWALGQIGGTIAIKILEEVRFTETAGWVLEEINLSLNEIDNNTD